MPDIIAQSAAKALLNDPDDQRPVDRSRVLITPELVGRSPESKGILFDGIVRGQHVALSPMLDPSGSYLVGYQLEADGSLVAPDQVRPVKGKNASAAS